MAVAAAAEPSTPGGANPAQNAVHASMDSEKSAISQAVQWTSAPFDAVHNTSQQLPVGIFWQQGMFAKLAHGYVACRYASSQ